MLPVLFTIGPVSVSSFGFFLSLGFLVATFLVWRLARAWDLDEEKVLDLVLLTFFGALLGGRFYFIIFNFAYFGFDPLKWLLLTRYPGLNFWGALLGGWLLLYFFSKRLKQDFLQVADVAAVGLLAAVALGDLGCFLAGCGVGVASNFLATPVVGVVGQRFPTPALEALLVFWALFNIWNRAKRFHFKGSIVGATFILLGAIKFLTSFLKEFGQSDLFLSLAVFALGMYIFYKNGKRSLKQDVGSSGKFLVSLITEKTSRESILKSYQKNWYNQKIVWRLRLGGVKRILRRLNVRSHPKNI